MNDEIKRLAALTSQGDEEAAIKLGRFLDRSGLIPKGQEAWLIQRKHDSIQFWNNDGWTDRKPQIYFVFEEAERVYRSFMITSFNTNEETLPLILPIKFFELEALSLEILKRPEIREVSPSHQTNLLTLDESGEICENSPRDEAPITEDLELLREFGFLGEQE